MKEISQPITTWEPQLGGTTTNPTIAKYDDRKTSIIRIGNNLTYLYCYIEITGESLTSVGTGTMFVTPPSTSENILIAGGFNTIGTGNAMPGAFVSSNSILIGDKYKIDVNDPDRKIILCDSNETEMDWSSITPSTQLIIELSTLIQTF